MLKKQWIRQFSFMLAVLLLFLFSFCGCASRPDTVRIVTELSRGLGIDSTVYSTRYIDSEASIPLEAVDSMFLGALPDVEEYSLGLCYRLNGGAEIGAFYTGSYDGYLLRSVLRERLDFLEANIADGEGFLVRSGSVTVYGFVPDAERALALLRSLV